MATSEPSSNRSSSGLAAFIFRYLDPLDFTVEAIYTVLIVLTFTLAINTFDERNNLGDILNQALLSGLFVATFGCAVAWGLIDGVMYVLTCLAERGQQNRTLRVIQAAPSKEEAIRLVSEGVEESLPVTMSDQTRAQFEALLYSEATKLAPVRIRIQRDDLIGAALVFLAAVIVALPVVLPLLLVSTSPLLAIRLSNLVAFVLLFYFGYRWARYAGGVPWKTGVALLAVGVIMVLIAIPLGG